MGRSPCCSKEGLNRGAWTSHEDKILTEYIKAHGEGRWRNLPKRAGLKRCGKSCRLRWLNYLRPDIKRGNISSDEEELIIRLHKLLGNRWSLIAGRLPGRTDNEIKNYWNTNLGKKVQDGQNSAEAVASRNDKNGRPMKKKKDAQMAPAATSSAHHVVRTRATRCSRVFINPHPQKGTIEPSETNTEEAKLQTSISGDYCRPALNQTSASTKINITTGLSITEKVEGIIDHNKNNYYSSDFMLDFNLGEFCLSDILNSDIADLGDLNDNCNGLSPSTSEQGTFIFSEEMFHDWTSTFSLQQAQAQAQAQQQNVASN